jgi:hypothetical protein
MAVQNYGAIMQGAADLTASPANAFAQGQQRRQAQEYRNSLLSMDQQRLGMDQQKFQAEQEDDEEDRALYAAWAKGDWATADAIDPVSTIGYKMKLAELQKMEAPTAPPEEVTLPSGRVLAMQGGNPIGQPWARPEEGGGHGAMQEPFDVQTYRYFLQQPQEVQAKILEYRRGNSTPEITRDTAEARAIGAKAGERQAEIDKKISNFANMGDALDIAATLIPIATGSAVGALADRAAGAFGFTPTGAEATASLRVLAAKVLENVPRMEGPQSDADAKMYKEAAGQLGDPTVTRAEKMAAIRTIRQLSAKYAARNAGRTEATPPAPGGPKPGDVVKGYKFKGGNPADKSNWVKQ